MLSTLGALSKSLFVTILPPALKMSCFQDENRWPRTWAKPSNLGIKLLRKLFSWFSHILSVLLRVLQAFEHLHKKSYVECFWGKKKKDCTWQEAEKCFQNNSMYRTMNHLPQAIDMIKEFLNIQTCCYLTLLFFCFVRVLSAVFHALEKRFLNFFFPNKGDRILED